MSALFGDPEKKKPVMAKKKEEEEDPKKKRALQLGRAGLVQTSPKGVLGSATLGRRQLTAT